MTKTLSLLINHLFFFFFFANLSQGRLGSVHQLSNKSMSPVELQAQQKLIRKCVCVQGGSVAII